MVCKLCRPEGKRTAANGVVARSEERSILIAIAASVRLLPLGWPQGLLQTQGLTLELDTQERPYGCDCGASFTRRDLLSRHVRLHHPQPPYLEDLETVQQPFRETFSSIPHNATRTRDPFVFYSPSQLQASQEINGTEAPAAYAVSPRQIFSHTPASTINTQENENAPFREIINDNEMHSEIRVLHEISDPSREELYPFDEFANFLWFLGFPEEWGSASMEIAGDITPSEGNNNNLAKDREANVKEGDDSPFQPWLPSVPSKEQCLHSYQEMVSRQFHGQDAFFWVDEAQREQIQVSLEEHRAITPGFLIPSRHTLSRYLAAFFEGFHSHLLFIHLPTFRLTDHPLELILAIMSAGAQYRFEHQNSTKFFKAAKAIVSQRHHLDDVTGASWFIGRNPTDAPGDLLGMDDDLGVIRCLLILMGVGTWQDTTMLKEALHLRSLLVGCLRRSGLQEIHQPSTTEHMDWLRWAKSESIRRTKLAAFSFVDMYSIAYNNYPPIRNHEVKLRLPCPTRVWNASNAMDWLEAYRVAGADQLFYHDALSLLLRNSASAPALSPVPSPLGNYYLLHGLIQRIHIIRELGLDINDDYTEFPEVESNRLEHALRSWTTMWQQAPESNIDPANENGPVPFTSSSMLCLAYSRLNLNLGPFRQLETRDPSIIAEALGRSPPLRNSGSIISALIYAIHSFSIPVRLGLDYVARSQAFFWSVRHALSSFECVVLLSKWLFQLAVTREPNLNAKERRILRWTSLVVEEAYDSIDFDDESPITRHSGPRELGLGVLAIWSRFFQHNTQWHFINILGQSLSLYAGVMAANFKEGPSDEFEIRVPLNI
ncbi:hypothetical protein N7481_006661 [Penicillium waksmanii]|uniref:uncharacterized protein n=1 Tax=Penicillium waksmanii TaxID=69791 RepID=UPI0025469DEF|nr:uncharacterized protein N7481_006661 [Penicillium waksmanii]KAJ5984562.1 hypothetical protein N7481_006661 [Penicillium waksmanii]